MKLRKFVLLALVAVAAQGYGQLTISGELRPRTELRKGYKSLTPDDAESALFVSQRTRINTAYKTDAYTFFLSFQDVRVWGDVKQLNVADKNGLALHQAWAKVNFSDGFALKLGRQEIVYDDSRIFGNVGWAQQGRSHDAAIFKFGNENYSLDLGFAYNQDKEALFGNLYTVAGNYKAMQYAWYHKDWSNVKASFLFLNNGLQNVAEEELRYSQTLGTHLKFKATDALSVNANAYLQTGNDVANRDLSAYLFGLDLGFKASSKLNLGLGLEMQSGNDYNGDASENKAFTPFYGTNHKFNGFMDYFYVGNHGNSVGLVDIYAKLATKLSDKSSLTGFLHSFSAQAEIGDGIDKKLGTELDLVYGYKMNKDVSIGAGYSHMFAAEGLENLRNNTTGNGNNWAWVMVTIKPTLFVSK
jgi:hypothetical protein